MTGEQFVSLVVLVPLGFLAIGWLVTAWDRGSRIRKLRRARLELADSIIARMRK